jgi:hypothetical protein
MVKRITKATRKHESRRVRKYAPLTVGGAEKIAKTELQQEIKEQAALIVRPPGRPVGTRAFQSVMRAKEILAQSAPLAARLLKTAAKNAAAKGDSAPAEFLLKHVSALDEKGKTIRPIDTSVDKIEGEGGSRAPTINIGWIASAAPALPSTVIDVKALPEHSDR